MKSKVLFASFVLMLVFIASAPAAVAQEPSRVSGKVHDENGDPAAGVTLRFEPGAGAYGGAFDVTTNKKGRFTYPNAQGATYDVTVQGNWYITRIAVKALNAASISGMEDMDATLAPGELPPGIPLLGGARMQIEIWVASGRASGGDSVAGLTDAAPALGELTALFDAQDWEGLIARSEPILAENPELAGEGGYLRAVALWQTGEIAAAVDEMRVALEVLPEQPGIHGTLATLLLSHGQGLRESGDEAASEAAYSESADLFAKQLEQTPAEVVYVTNRVVALDLSGRHEELAAAIDGLLAIDPANANAYLRLAELHVAAGDIDTAIETLDMMPEGGESAASIIYNAAVDMWNEGKLEAAAAVAEKGIQMAPQMPDFYRLKAMALITTDQPQAVQLLDKYLTMVPEDAEGIEADRELVEALRARLEG